MTLLLLFVFGSFEMTLLLLFVFGNCVIQEGGGLTQIQIFDVLFCLSLDFF